MTLSRIRFIATYKQYQAAADFYLIERFRNLSIQNVFSIDAVVMSDYLLHILH